MIIETTYEIHHRSNWRTPDEPNITTHHGYEITGTLVNATVDHRPHYRQLVIDTGRQGTVVVCSPRLDYGYTLGEQISVVTVDRAGTQPGGEHIAAGHAGSHTGPAVQRPQEFDAHGRPTGQLL